VLLKNESYDVLGNGRGEHLDSESASLLQMTASMRFVNQNEDDRHRDRMRRLKKCCQEACIVVSCLPIGRDVATNPALHLEEDGRVNTKDQNRKDPPILHTQLTIDDFTNLDERSSTRFVRCYISNTRRNTHDRKRSEMDVNEKVRHIHSSH
jgi:hypothetical protein